MQVRAAAGAEGGLLHLVADLVDGIDVAGQRRAEIHAFERKGSTSRPWDKDEIGAYARIVPSMTSPSSADVLHPVSGCTCARLRRLTRRMTALYDSELAPTGLRLTQYSLLATLRREGKDGGVAVSDLAAAMDMDRTTLTRNLRPLLAQDWVELRADPLDARVRRAVITPKGNAAFVAAMPYWRIAQDHVNRTLGEGNVGALHQWLDRVTPAFRAEPSED